METLYEAMVMVVSNNIGPTSVNVLSYVTMNNAKRKYHACIILTSLYKIILEFIFEFKF